MFERGYCHRDIKLENLLISYNLELKIADLGLATEIRGMNDDGWLEGMCGSTVITFVFINFITKYYY